MKKNNLRHLRKQSGLTTTKVAELMGMSLGGYQKIEAGTRRLTVEHIAQAAKVFGVTESDVIREQMGIPIIGSIGQGGEISPEINEARETGSHSIVPFATVMNGLIGFEIYQESLWPRYASGDVLLCTKTGNLDSLGRGQEAVIELKSGRTILKKLFRENDIWRLESHNSPPARFADIKWASEVMYVLRAGQYEIIETKIPRYTRSPKQKKQPTKKLEFIDQTDLAQQCMSRTHPRARGVRYTHTRHNLKHKRHIRGSLLESDPRFVYSLPL